MPQDILSNINLKGQNLEGASKILSDANLRAFWGKLTNFEKKELLEGTKLTVAEINKLVKELNKAAKAMEEYTGKIDKYESTFKKLTNSYKEGRNQAKLYLDEAAKSGGKLAVLGAAVALVTKEVKKNIDAMQDYVNAVRRYDIEQERFSKSSLIQKKSLDSMRWSLSLTKNEMASFFEELKRGESLGFNTKQMEQSILKLKSVYGNDAMKMFGSYQDILTKMPTVSNQIKAGKGFQGFNEGDVYNLMASGQYGTMLELQAGGMFGGEAEKSKSAEVENVQKMMDSFTEYAKDEASRYFMPSLSLASKTLDGVNTIIDYAAKAVVLLGIISAVKGTGVVGDVVKNLGGGSLITGAKTLGKGLLGKGGGLALRGLSLSGSALSLGGAIAAGLGGGQLLGAGISKAFDGTTYNPKELYSALTSGPGALKSFGKGLFSGYGQFYSEDKGEGLKERIAGTVNTGRYVKDEKTGKTVRMGKADRKTLLDFEKEMKATWENLNLIRDSWQMQYESTKRIADIDMDIASKSGDMVEYKQVSAEKQNALNKQHSELMGLYEKEEQGIISKMKEMEGIKGFEKTRGYKAAQANLKSLREKMGDLDKVLIDGRIEVMNSVIQEQISQGGAGSKGTNKLRMAKAAAEAALSKARFVGGEYQAAGAARGINIKEAKNFLEGIEKAMAIARETRVKGNTAAERLAAEKSLTEMEIQRTEAEEKLKNAMIDTRDLEILTRDIEIYLKGLGAQQSYVEDINGSFQALKPFWQAEVETKRRLAEIAKQDMQRMAASHGMGSQAYKEKEAEYAIKSLDAKKAELELAKKVRDKKKEEITFASDWMREQADYLEEMGGGFSQILSLRSQAIEKEREAISAQQDFIDTGIKTGTLEGFELIKAQTDLERMKMKMTRDTIGVQKSAYEKFVGMAFGQLSDIGIKRGRMDDAVLMGTAATRVKGRDGMYVKGTPNMTRDQVMAVMATGGSIDGITANKDTKKADYFTGSRVESGKPKEELQVNGKVQLALDQGLILKMEDWSFNLSKNKEFGAAIVQANRIVTENNTKASGASK